METRRARSDWDPLEDAAVDDPVQTHRHLRSMCPVAYSEQFGGFWSLTTYADVERAAQDPRQFSSAQGTSIPKIPMTVPTLPLNADPPDHFSIRSVLQPYFARGRIRALEGRIRGLAAAAIDDFISGGAGDFVEDIATPFPGRVLCLFVGLPASDWNDIMSWSNTIVGRASIDPPQVALAVESKLTYIRGIVADRRQRPRDPADDIVTGLLGASLDGRPVTDDEVVGVISLLLGAGHETVTSALGNSVRHLAEHPEEQQRLRANPELISVAVEEFLRYESPAQLLARTTTQDVEIGGQVIPGGEQVALLWTSANRDGSKFPEPDQCVLDRQPNRHLAFGAGIHRCLGAELARVELRIGLGEMLRRTRSFELAGAYSRTSWPVMGMRHLPIRTVPSGDE